MHGKYSLEKEFNILLSLCNLLAYITNSGKMYCPEALSFYTHHWH
jgi:hypothetical protein